MNEVPGKVAFYINIGRCLSACKGCHSEYLQESVNVDNYTMLSATHLRNVAEYHIDNGCNAIVIMGGDNNADIDLDELAMLIYTLSKIAPVCLYGSTITLEDAELFDFEVKWLKTGKYWEEFGGLSDPRTNQRFYERKLEVSYAGYTNSDSIGNVGFETVWIDQTEKFREKVNNG